MSELRVLKVYKIRRKKDGLFSTGGTYVRWEEHGKTYQTLGRARSAMSQMNHDYHYSRHNAPHFYEGAEIVEFNLEAVAVHEFKIPERKR